MSQNGSLLQTKASKFKRLNYFHGMLLTENDFQEEQKYFREKLKLHNRLHGQGVAWGLELKPYLDPNSANNPNSKIIIAPGVALDCEGNEIIVCSEYVLDLQEKITWLEKQDKIDCENYCFSPPEGSAKLWIGLQYCECRSDPMQQYTSVCAEDKLLPEFSRVREGFCVAVFAADELPSCCASVKQKKDCCAHDDCRGVPRCCGDDHFVILGSVEICCPNPDKIKASQINASDKRKYVFVPTGASDWPFQHWEETKLGLIHTICRQAGWQDVSSVIGRPVESAQEILQKLMGMDQVTAVFVSELSVDELQAKLVQARDALPCAPAGSDIELIVDKQGGCVLLPLVQAAAGTARTLSPRRP